MYQKGFSASNDQINVSFTYADDIYQSGKIKLDE